NQDCPVAPQPALPSALSFAPATPTAPNATSLLSPSSSATTTQPPKLMTLDSSPPASAAKLSFRRASPNSTSARKSSLRQKISLSNGPMLLPAITSMTPFTQSSKNSASPLP